MQPHRTGRSGWFSPAGIAVVLSASALLIALGWWTYEAVEGSLREIRANTLAAELEAEVRALRLSRDPQASLAALREVAIGERGELFAVDANGVMQSESRFASEMIERGMLAAGTGTRGVVELRVPGAGGDARTRAPTRLAMGIARSAQAADAEGRRGSMLDPYLNHRGEEVIGAWRWIPERQLAIAAEMPETQAYAPLQYLRIAFGVVFGTLVVAAAAALASWLSVLRLRGELGGQRRIGAYRLEKSIGEGGMANVYLARHDLLKRPCAVKLLKPARASDEMIARFEREVQMASALAHPNIVEVYDYGRSSEGLFYYAMEYLEGTNLGELVAKDGAIPLARALPILRQVCAGLAAAHRAGLVHRDIKPENIMVCRRGGAEDVVKILDFGLAKNTLAEHSRDLTRGLRILGTPLYMAPERLRDPADVDTRADIYAFGAVAFFLLAGRRMFDSADDLGLTSKVLNEEPPLLSTVAAQPIPRELDLIVQACLEKKRENRPQRISDVAEALEDMLEAGRAAARS